MTVRRLRSSEVLGLSITELLLIIIFGLVLVAHLFQSDLSAAKAALENVEKSKPVVSDIEHSTRILARATGKKMREVRPAVDLSSRLEGIEETISEVAREFERLFSRPEQERPLPEIWSELVRTNQMIQELQESDGDTLETLDRLAREKRQLREQIARLENRTAELQKLLEDSGQGQLVQAEQQLNQLRDANADLRRKLHTEGWGNPPCWTDRDGNIEYVMTVEIGEDALTSSPALPSYRKAELKALSLSEDDLAATYTRQEFRETFAPLNQWARMTEDDCRFHVKVRDAAVTKENYKAGLRQIEDYFYKLHVGESTATEESDG